MRRPARRQPASARTAWSTSACRTAARRRSSRTSRSSARRAAKCRKDRAGNPRAFDVRTGAKLWEFQTVPRAGEPFNETWGNGWEDRGGTNMWAFAAPVDAARGIAYLPIAGPAANYYGGDRPGDERVRELDRRGRRTHRATTAGTSRRCITISGTSTCRPRAGCSSSSATARECRRSRTSASRLSSTCSTARPASR